MHILLFDIENWKEIGATLARNKTRTFLTGFGIFWGTAMLAMLLGGARGAKDLLMRNFDGFATNSAVMWSQRTTEAYRGNSKNRSWHLDVTDVERIEQGIEGLKVVTANYQYGGVSFKNGKYTLSGNVNGVDPDYAEVMLPAVYDGRFINEADVVLERKVAAIGNKVANELFPGETSAVGKNIEVNGISYKVIGVIGQTNEIQIGGRLDEGICLPSSTFRRAFKYGDNVDDILLVADDGVKISNLIPQIRHLIYVRHHIAPTDEAAMRIMDISEQFEMVDNLFKGLSILALFIGVSTLLAGVIGIGNIMWVIVKERTQEIGIRRAIGAKPMDIVVQILSEGMMLTAVAGLAGIAFATFVLWLAETLTANDVSIAHFQMNIGQALAIMITFAVLGTLAGLIPASKAMSIKPIEALNDK